MLDRTVVTEARYSAHKKTGIKNAGFFRELISTQFSS